MPSYTNIGAIQPQPQPTTLLTVREVMDLIPVPISRHWVERHVPGKRKLGRKNYWDRGVAKRWIDTWVANGSRYIGPRVIAVNPKPPFSGHVTIHRNALDAWMPDFPHHNDIEFLSNSMMGDDPK